MRSNETCDLRLANLRTAAELACRQHEAAAPVVESRNDGFLERSRARFSVCGPAATSSDETPMQRRGKAASSTEHRVKMIVNRHDALVR